MIIAVVGGDSSASVLALTRAEAVGAEIARRNCVLICGTRWRDGGGLSRSQRSWRDDNRRLARADNSHMNEYVQIPIVTGVGDARNVIIVSSADAVIALDGEYGTLSEIAHALNRGKPIVGMSTWALSKEGREDPPIYRTEDPAEAVRWAIEAASKGT